MPTTPVNTTDTIEQFRVKVNDHFADSDPLTLANGLTVGTGDALTLYDATAWPGQRIDVRKGTTASPDNSAGPLIKAHRTIDTTLERLAELASNPSSDWGDGLAAIHGHTKATAASEVQSVGVLGVAANYGLTDPLTTGPRADACGLYGAGRIQGSGDGRGIGAFLVARVDSTSSTAGGQGLEVTLRNGGPADDTGLNLTGADKTMGVWIHGQSARRVATGIKFGNPFGGQFGTGIHFNNQSGTNALAGTTTGPTVNQDIRSDSSAATSLLIKGTHATAALAVGSGSGGVVIGVDSPTNSGLLEVHGGGDIVLFGRATGGQTGTTVRLRSNGLNGCQWFYSGAANNYLTGTVAGDTGMKVAAASTAFHLGGTTKVVSVTQDNKLGFHAATPIVKPTGYTAPANLTTDRTFDANATTVDELADVLGTLIEDLKLYGLIGA